MLRFGIGGATAGVAVGASIIHTHMTTLTQESHGRVIGSERRTNTYSLCITVLTVWVPILSPHLPARRLKHTVPSCPHFKQPSCLLGGSRSFPICITPPLLSNGIDCALERWTERRRSPSTGRRFIQAYTASALRTRVAYLGDRMTTD